MRHAAFLIHMIDMTVNMLGVDNEELVKNMSKLGEKRKSTRQRQPHGKQHSLILFRFV